MGARPRPAAQTVPGSGGGGTQLALPLEPDGRHARSSRADAVGADARRLPLTTGLSVGVHPLELLRPHLPDEVALDHASCASAAHRIPRGRRRAGRRPPAPLDRERDRLHAARGRVRPGQPDRPAARLRASPRARAGRAPARSRDGTFEKVGGTEPPRRPARDARPARAPHVRGLAEVRDRSRRRTTSDTASVFFASPSSMPREPPRTARSNAAAYSLRRLLVQRRGVRIPGLARAGQSLCQHLLEVAECAPRPPRAAAARYARSASSSQASNRSALSCSNRSSCRSINSPKRRLKDHMSSR